MYLVDGCVGFVVWGSDGVDGLFVCIFVIGFVCVECGLMLKVLVFVVAVVFEDVGLLIVDMDVIKIYNLFVVNDFWFVCEMGVDVEIMNPFGCSLIYGYL